MKKLGTVSAVALLTAALLSGCTGTEAPTQTPTPSETEPAKAARLKVPETATGTSALLIVNGGTLERGTRATIYGFGGGWDGTPVTCDDPDAATREITLTGDGSDQTVPFPVTPGVMSWVLVAGDSTTPCADDDANTRVLLDTDVDVSADKPAGVNQPVTITLPGNTLPETVPAPATLDVLGPCPTLPLADAADCATAPIASTSIVELSRDADRTVHTFETTFTPTEAGIYRIVLDIPETEQSTALNTCANSSEAVSIAIPKA